MPEFEDRDFIVSKAEEGYKAHLTRLYQWKLIYVQPSIVIKLENIMFIYKSSSVSMYMVIQRISSILNCLKLFIDLHKFLLIMPR